MILTLAAPLAMAVVLGSLQVGLLRPLVGFGLFMILWIAGIVIGAVQAFRAYRGGDVAGTAVSAGVVLVLVAGLLLSARSLRAPRIHDVTTDLESPPEYVQAVALPANEGRDLSYPHGPEETPEIQRAAYPELSPIRIESPPDRAFELARDAARALGWQVTWSNSRLGKFEAVARSTLFRFADDVVVRVEAGAEGGSVVDVRSTSRVGRSDLGANAARIRAFAGALRERAGQP